MVPPVKVIEPFAAVSVPPQVLVGFPATIMGVGKVSVKVTPVYGVLFGFWSVMVRFTVSPTLTVPDEKRFVRPIS